MRTEVQQSIENIAFYLDAQKLDAQDRRFSIGSQELRARIGRNLAHLNRDQLDLVWKTMQSLLPEGKGREGDPDYDGNVAQTLLREEILAPTGINSSAAIQAADAI